MWKTLINLQKLPELGNEFSREHDRIHGSSASRWLGGAIGFNSIKN